LSTDPRAHAPASTVFPGLLFRELPGEKSFQRQPVAELPEAFRNSDVNLQYAPLVGLVWSKYIILIGNRSFGIACQLPYAGWTNFKSESLKYTNILPAKLGKTSDVIILSLGIGDRTLDNNPLQLRSEFFEENLIHIVQVASEGMVTLADGSTRQGVVLDIDTVRNLTIPPAEFSANLPGILEDIHNRLKTVFFSCLTDRALAGLEPTYE
jgi:hypothetical protein